MPSRKQEERIQNEEIIRDMCIVTETQQEQDRGEGLLKGDFSAVKTRLENKKWVEW